jgi:outer membrane protein
MKTLLAALGLGLFACAGQGAADAVTNSPTSRDLVIRALAYSPALRAVERQADAARQQGAQAVAAGRPSVEADAHAGHFEGLSDARFGPSVTIPSVADRYSARLGVAQPLYTGGEQSARQRAARRMIESAEAETESVQGRVAAQTLAAYWSWSQAVSLADALHDTVTWMEAHLLDVRALRGAGLASETDLLAAEAQAEGARLRLSEAGRKSDLARASLSRLAGMELAAEQRPRQAPPAFVEEGLPTLDAALLRSTNRAELVILERTVRALDERVRAARGAGRPQVYASAWYEQGNPNFYNFPLEEKWQDTAFVGITATWKVFDSGLVKAGVKEQIARRDAAAGTLAEARDEFRLDARRAHIELGSALHRVRAAARTEAAAERSLRQATDHWKNGMARHSDVLDAEARHSEARCARLGACADVMLAKAGLAFATGDLLQLVEKPGGPLAEPLE